MTSYLKKGVLAYVEPYQGLPPRLWVGLSAAFVNSLSSAVILFLALFLTQERNLSVSTTGLLVTLFGIGATFGAYIGGHLCNRYSSHRVSLISLFIIALCLLYIPFCTDFWMFTALMLTLGLSAYAFIPANRLWILAQCGEQDKVRANSLRYMLINLGTGISVFIDGFLAHYSYTLLFIMNGGIIVASAFILACCGGKEEKEAFVKESKRAFWQFHIFDNKFYAINYFMLLIAATLYAQLKVTYAIYLRDYYQVTTPMLSGLFLVNCLGIVVLQVWLIQKISRFDQAIIAGIGTFLIGFGLFMLILGSNYYLALFSALIWTLGEILALPVIQMLLYNKSPAATRATHMGLYQSVYAFANVIGPAIGSWLYRFHHGTVLWIVCGLFGALCWRLSYHIRERKNILSSAAEV